MKNSVRLKISNKTLYEMDFIELGQLGAVIHSLYTLYTEPENE
jgi:hypothetical protein